MIRPPHLTRVMVSERLAVVSLAKAFTAGLSFIPRVQLSPRSLFLWQRDSSIAFRHSKDSLIASLIQKLSDSESVGEPFGDYYGGFTRIHFRQESEG